MQLCDVCGNEANLRCSKCQSANYCGTNCQRTAWKAGHRKVCQAPSREAANQQHSEPSLTAKISALTLSTSGGTVGGLAQNGAASPPSATATAESAQIHVQPQQTQPQPPSQAPTGYKKPPKPPKLIPKAPERVTDGGRFAASVILAEIERHDAGLFDYAALVIFRTMEFKDHVLQIYLTRTADGSLRWQLIERAHTVFRQLPRMDRHARRRALANGGLIGFKGSFVALKTYWPLRELDREGVLRELAPHLSLPGPFPGAEVQLNTWTRKTPATREQRQRASTPPWNTLCHQDDYVNGRQGMYLVLNQRNSEGPPLRYLAQEPGTVVAQVAEGAFPAAKPDIGVLLPRLPDHGGGSEFDVA